MAGPKASGQRSKSAKHLRQHEKSFDDDPQKKSAYLKKKADRKLRKLAKNKRRG